jgi:hypothetical protein
VSPLPEGRLSGISRQSALAIQKAGVSAHRTPALGRSGTDRGCRTAGSNRRVRWARCAWSAPPAKNGLSARSIVKFDPAVARRRQPYDPHDRSGRAFGLRPQRAASQCRSPCRSKRSRADRAFAASAGMISFAIAFPLDLAARLALASSAARPRR